jgi:hypothetical protein
MKTAKKAKDGPAPLYLNETEIECTQTIDVLHEDPNLLVLTSKYIDVIWDGVALAQKEGYQIDTMISYVVSRTSGSAVDTNLLVAMSK